MKLMQKNSIAIECYLPSEISSELLIDIEAFTQSIDSSLPDNHIEKNHLNWLNLELYVVFENKEELELGDTRMYEWDLVYTTKGVKYVKLDEAHAKLTEARAEIETLRNGSHLEKLRIRETMDLLLQRDGLIRKLNNARAEIFRLSGSLDVGDRVIASSEHKLAAARAEIEEVKSWMMKRLLDYRAGEKFRVDEMIDFLGGEEAVEMAERNQCREDEA